MQEENLRKGPWLEEEDERLVAIVELLGERRWDSLAKASGLRRSGKSCRLRWVNYLRPNLKRGRLSAEEQRLVIQLQEQWGNKWSKIARALPGRTDNEIKNYWRSHLRNKAKAQEQSRLQICSASCIGFSKQNVSISKCDTISSDGDYSNSYKENSFGSMDNSFSFNTLELSNFEITSSPYEMRLSDWLLLGGSNEQSEAQGNYPLGYPVAEDGEIASAWDSSFSLWD